jgi:hypothetical protein
MTGYTAIQALNDGRYEVEFWDGRSYGVSTYDSIDAAWEAFLTHARLGGEGPRRLSFSAPIRGEVASWLR